MWMREEGKEDTDRYKDLLLDDLIYSSGDRIIKLEKHPLLFLLCLVDTIEPQKHGKQLNDVSIQVDDNCISIENATATPNDLNFLATANSTLFICTRYLFDS